MTLFASPTSRIEPHRGQVLVVRRRARMSAAYASEYYVIHHAMVQAVSWNQHGFVAIEFVIKTEHLHQAAQYTFH